MGGNAGGRPNLIRDLFWTRTGLLLAVLVIVGGVSLAVAGGVLAPGLLQSLLTALGTGTLVSAVVGFVQTLITATSTQQAMVEPLVEENRRALRALSDDYRALNQEFFPTRIFDATDRPDPLFNQVLTSNLNDSRVYFFHGFSARFAAVRVILAQGERELRAVIADPTASSALSGRARHLMKCEGADADTDRIQEQLHDEICLGLVGLFLARGQCSLIDITLVPDPPLDRYELFDDSVWITLYSDTRNGVALFPRSLRFSDRSYVYGMERAELARTTAAPRARKLLITPDTTRDEFRQQLVDVTGAGLSPERFDELAERFREFRLEFATEFATEVAREVAQRLVLDGVS